MDMANSPVTENETVKLPQKRPRPVLSCLECRRKKLKCSRTMPCAQCTKIGHVSRCSYNEYPPGGPSGEFVQEAPYSEDGGTARKVVRRKITELHDETGSQLQTSEAKLGIIEDLQSRVEKLENLITTYIPNLGHSRDCKPADSHDTKRYGVSLRGVVRLKDSRTRYHGQNQRVALLNHFEEAQAFMKKIETGTCSASIAEIRNDLASLQPSWSLQQKSEDREQLQGSTAISQRMLQLLPLRSSCNKLVTIYLENFENELRVLHKPSFSSVVGQFWGAQRMDSLQFSDFVPQLLCVLAIASSLDDACLLEDEGSRGHGMASTYCALVEGWLDSLAGKQRLKFSTLQTQTLLLMAKQSSLHRVKDMWNATGSLVRSAMIIGIHRDPSESPQIPIFWAELRRRLWITIVELDLRTSLTYGMPTMVCATDFTCGIPANINDTDLNLTMTHPPSPKSFTQWSDSLPQVVLAKSLRQRLDAARLLSNIEGGLDYDEIVERGKTLEQILQDLPPPLKFDYLPDHDSQKPGRLMTRVLLDVHIRRLILNLYGPFARADGAVTDFGEARKGFIRSSLVILCYQDIFDPDFADLDVIASPRYWDLFHVSCKNDMMHASLGVCLEIKRWNSKLRTRDIDTPAMNGRTLPHTPGAPESLDPVFSSWTKSSLTKTVEDNIDPLLRRLGRFGSDPKDLLCLSIVLNSVRTNQSLERKEQLMESGIRELISAYQQHLQKRGGTGRRNSGVDVAGTQLRPLSQAENQNMPVSSGFSFGLFADSEFDFGEIDFDLAHDSQLDPLWH